LHDKARGLIENTAPAFLAAIEGGYGIECDLQPASDGSPMVFHDATLDRLVEATGPIAARTPRDIASLRYKNQDTRILSFGELLELIDGRVPLLAEVKSDVRAPKAFLSRIAAIASHYRGPVALMSFSRTVMVQLGKLACGIPRGLVVGTHQLAVDWSTAPSEAGRNAAVAALLGSMPDGMSFLAVEVKMLEAARVWIDDNAPQLALFTWTVRTPQERAAATRWADAPIFEEAGRGDHAPPA
jgi:glycerophosphoryl diester phosphodiesterase